MEEEYKHFKCGVEGCVYKPEKPRFSKGFVIIHLMNEHNIKQKELENGEHELLEVYEK